MRNSSARLIFASTLLGFLIVPNVTQAVEADTQQSAPSSEEPAELCRKGIKRSGLPSKLSVVAGLSAIQQWTQAAMKHGGNYAMWHNAKSSGVKCEKFDRSDYFKCTASGKPCRAVSLDQATADKQSN